MESGFGGYGEHPSISKLLGEWLTPDTRIVATDIGQLAYYSRLPIIDARGLTDPTLARLAKPPEASNLWGVLHLDEAIRRADVYVIGFLTLMPDGRMPRPLPALTPDEQWLLYRYRVYAAVGFGWPERLRRDFTCVSVRVPRRGYVHLVVRRDRQRAIWRDRDLRLADDPDCLVEAGRMLLRWNERSDLSALRRLRPLADCSR